MSEVLKDCKVEIDNATVRIFCYDCGVTLVERVSSGRTESKRGVKEERKSTLDRKTTRTVVRGFRLVWRRPGRNVAVRR